MAAKICFKCEVKKELSEFYVHKEMADGHLNKCKDCTKKDVKDKYNENVLIPGYIEKERKRGRQKHHRLYKGMGRSRPVNNDRWSAKYPEKRYASNRSQHLKPPTAGVEKHHWNYSEAHQKDVIWLTKKEHMKAHRFMVYDQERMMYRRYDTNELLDTKEKHEAFIRLCIETKED